MELIEDGHGVSDVGHRVDDALLLCAVPLQNRFFKPAKYDFRVLGF
jgi:hypothetical protein